MSLVRDGLVWVSSVSVARDGRPMSFYNLFLKETLSCASSVREKDFADEHRMEINVTAPVPTLM